MSVRNILTVSADFCSSLGEEYRQEAILTQIMPCIQQLATDTNQHVKSALASVIMSLSPIVGKERYVYEPVPHSGKGEVCVGYNHIRSLKIMQDPLKFSFFFHQLLTYYIYVYMQIIESPGQYTFELHSFETLTFCKNNA